MELFTTVYCLFMVFCFDTKTKVPKLNYQDFDGKYLPCPKNCDCYQAPENKFDMDFKSNSMVCRGERDDLFNRYFGSNDQTRPVMKLNTLVLNKLKLPFDNERIVINAESLVIQNTNLPLNPKFAGNFRYLTMYDQKEFASLPDMPRKLEGIYILNVQCKHEKDFLLDELEKSPELQSFTLRQSCHQTISRRSMKLLSSTRTIDLSGNKLVSADAIVPENENKHLTSLYLNDNNLLSIPIGLGEKFPELKIFHLYGNPIMILDYKEITSLIGQDREFILFETDPATKKSKEPEIYNVGKLMRWIPQKIDLFMPNTGSQINSIKSIGTLDSLQILNIICGNGQRVKYSPEFTFDSCDEWEKHPEGLYLNGQNIELRVKKQTIPILGKVIDYQEKEYKKLSDGQNTFWLRLSGTNPVQEQTNFDLRNMLYQAQLLGQYFVFRFDDMKSLDKQHADWNQMLVNAIQQRPNVIGFELDLLDASFADLSFELDPLRERQRGDSVCSFKFPPGNHRERLAEKLDIFTSFQERIMKIYDRNLIGDDTIQISYAYLFTIDVKCLHLLNTFVGSDISSCAPHGWRGFDGITIVNIDKQDKNYDQQMKDIAEFRSRFDKLLFIEEHSGVDKEEKSQRIVSLISKQS